MNKKIRLIVFSIIITCLLLFFPNIVQARERNTEIKIEVNPIFTIPYEKALGASSVYISAASSADDSSSKIIMNYHVNMYCIHRGGNLNREKSKVKASVINRNTKIIDNNTISHSYMFVGIDGIGKKLIAKEFARKIYCIF